MTLYPDGYGTREVSLEQLKARHAAKMHPEFARRFFAYIESQGGRMGVGGGWRGTQPTGYTFAPEGKSFHQDQRFASGFVGYAAVDLVMRNPGKVHRAPTWAETADAPEWGLHTFITSPQEPWHIQCIEMRGWQSWVNAGRPDPLRRTLPGDVVVPPPPPMTEVDMIAIRFDRGAGAWTGLMYTGTHLAHVTTPAAWSVPTGHGVPVVTVDAAQLDDLIRSSQTTTPCPPEFVNTARGAAWTASRG